MSGEVVRIPMSARLRRVRVLAGATVAGAAPGGTELADDARAGRLLALRDAALEQQRAQQAAQACLAAVQAGVRDLRQRVDQRLDAIADIATELGMALAAEIVGDALARGAVDIAPIVQRCLRGVVARGDRVEIAVHLSPADLARLEASGPALEGVRLVRDESLPPASVRVESGAGAVAYEPRAALARVCDELRKELAQ